MAAVQLRLFPPPKPLLERFGAEFFRRVPACPGVYLMGGECERLLYVGQSHNLRVRLNAYKNLQPEHASRKLVRLVHRVRSITWEVCDSAISARLRENELLRRHKPRFNVVNTRPEHYEFVGVRAEGGSVAIRLARAATPEQGERLHGAFKGPVRQACAALARLLWSVARRPVLPTDLPAGWLRTAAPDRIAVRLAEPAVWLGRLNAYFAGESSALVEQLEADLPSEACRFLRGVWTLDLDRLKGFYQFGTRRARRLRVAHALEWIRPDELDDLVVTFQDAPDASTIA